MRIEFEVKDAVDTDVIVVGGGPAGIAAALASARSGAGTTLIEQYNSVGGMATVGLVGPFMTSYDTEGKEQIVKGVFSELVGRMLDEGGAVDPADAPAGSAYASFIHAAHQNTTPFDPEIMKYVAMEMLVEAGVAVRLRTQLIRAEKDGDRIARIVIADKSGLSLAKAKVFVDCTGDGDLAALAGNAFEKGRPEDGRLQPATMFFRIGGVDDERVEQWAREYLKPGERLFSAMVEKARADGRYPENCPRDSVGLYKQPRSGEWRVNTSRVLNIDGTDPESLTRAEIEGRRQAVALLRFLGEYCPGLEHAYLMDTGAQVGIRETRRIEGRYQLTRRDVQEARRFDDSIARYSFFMDIHNPTGSGQEGHRRLFVEGGPYFEIPYRCLLPSGVPNLLVAGRCIASDHQANGAVRVMPACFATGQAAGTAAAMSVRTGAGPGELDVQEIRDTLRSSGCVV